MADLSKFIATEDFTDEERMMPEAMKLATISGGDDGNFENYRVTIEFPYLNNTEAKAAMLQVCQWLSMVSGSSREQVEQSTMPSMKWDD